MSDYQRQQGDESSSLAGSTAGGSAAPGTNAGPGDTNDISPPGKKVQVVVLGDIYWDSVAVHTKPGLIHCHRPAGAWLLQRFLCLATQSKGQVRIVGYPFPAGYITEQMKSCGLKETTPEDGLELSNWLRAASRARLFPKGSGEKPEETKVYRLEQSFGFVDDIEENIRKDKYTTLNKAILQFLGSEELRDYDQRIIVINDNPMVEYKVDGNEISATSFRLGSEIKDVIEKLAEVEKQPLLILSIKGKIAESEVLKIINSTPALKDRTVVIVSAAQLRSEGHNVPSTLALETRASNLWNEHNKIPLSDLMGCRYVLVHDLGDVHYFDNSEKQDGRNKPGKFGLYFCPYVGRPENNPDRYGKMSGYVKILIATIVKNILRMENGDLFNGIGEGICEGLNIWEKHFKHGFLPSEAEPWSTHSEEDKKEWSKNLFKKNKKWHPFDKLFEPNDNDEKQKAKIAWIEFPLPEYYSQYCPMQAEEKFKNWSRVDSFMKENDMDKFKEMLCSVVREGVETIESEAYQKNNKILCPVAKIGDIKIVDRDEINGLIDIYKLILKYLQDKDDKKPLSLAIFGPPGTGKSSAVKKILKAARSATAKAEGGEALGCNLSQLTDPKNLTAAFHQAQDRALAEEVPLVFFDEFDTSFEQPYGWLKYFLAPMEDGTFKPAEANESYRVGKAIFAFAGGTADTFEKFQENVGENKEVKGPDFISRLRGFLNVPSINMEEKHKPVSNLLALRRAIILHSILKEKAKGILDPSGKIVRIEKTLINAFLQIKEYRHGIRSMVAIVQMSRPEGGRLQVASLPSRPQLRMHVNDVEFIELTAS